MPGAPILTRDQVDAICEMRERGYSTARIRRVLAREGVEISKGAVDWRCLRAGADLPPERRPRTHSLRPGETYWRGDRPFRTFSPEEDARLLALEREGLRKAEIGRRLGRRPHSVTARLATLARREARREDAETGGMTPQAASVRSSDRYA
jgi:hypothetical protein